MKLFLIVMLIIPTLLLISATTIGIGAVSAEQVQPKQTIVKPNQTNTGSKPNNPQEQEKSAESKAIQRLVEELRGQQEMESQNRQTDKDHTAQDIEMQGKLAKYTEWLMFVSLLQFLALLGTGIIIYLQKNLMGKHATHLENLATATGANANAAQANANAIINIERAWLIPSDTVSPKVLPGIRLEPEHVTHLVVKITNFGRTPAWLTDWSFAVEVIDNNTDIRQLASPQPEADHPNARPFPPGKEEEFTVIWKIHPGDIDDIRDGRKQLYVHGYISYRNTVGRENCISQFCFHHLDLLP
jgi:hypothetical protein